MRAEYFSALNSSFQRVAVDILNLPGGSWFPSFDGFSLTRGALFGGIGQIVFYGTDLAQAPDGSVSGTVTGFDIYFPNNFTKAVEVTGITGFDIGDLAAAAATVNNTYDAPGFTDFLDVLHNGDAMTVIGTSGKDVLESGPGIDVLKGGRGNDVFILHDNDGGSSAQARTIELINGGRGKRDMLTGEDLETGINVNLQKSTLEYPSFSAPSGVQIEIVGIEGAAGTDFKDVMIGDSHANVFRGFDGADTLKGRGGHDQLFGNKGSDRMFGAGGDDFLFGGRGADYMDGGSGTNVLDGGDGRDVMRGGAGHNTLTGGKGADSFELFGAGNAGTEYFITDFNSTADLIGFTLDLQGLVGAVNEGDNTRLVNTSETAGSAGWSLAVFEDVELILDDTSFYYF